MAEVSEVKSENMQKSQVDTETTERIIAEKHIGARIKRLRLKKSMGLVELGKLTGLSASFLSQLETGRVVPTLRNLSRIAMVFSKDLSYFFETEPRTLFQVHRRKERVRLPQTSVDSPAYNFESLAYMVPDRHMDPYFAEFIPRADDADPGAHMHPGYEFLYLLEGELEIHHGDQHSTLHPRDAVYFDSGTPHSYRSIGKKPAEAIIVAVQQPSSVHTPPMQPASAARPSPVKAVSTPR
ncbi:MAG: XRE family transcriptional regulator [Terracidiphilus sp.]|jgi:transcriptional regulator with XRE-family HTH domain